MNAEELAGALARLYVQAERWEVTVRRQAAEIDRLKKELEAKEPPPG